ncbi:endogenous retrovirus group K member 7 Env polyprotein-like isoform X2 [Dama dama]|uniref:endogenous retrovirus group K member 7 Env polyprotein-like isoform X2 n=1 Tax=Dama dama TaxID=30532 RepID=UPI002A365EF7|nr:endogenous retrovirus group K member 7 Env polyprotein-like isoform X2 [Dama dama]
MCFFRNHNVSGCLTVTDVGYSDYSTGWSVDIPGVTKLTGHAQRRNGTGPQDIPFCGLGHKGKHIAVPWKLCRNETATVYSIPNSTHSLWDWSPDSERNPGKESNRQFAARIWNLGGTLVYQTEVWKLLAAFETSGSFMQTGEKVKGGFFWNATWRYPRACVPYSFMIIAGSVNLTKNNSQYYIHCFNCPLSNCIRGIRNNSGVLIVKQPPFVMLPVNLTEPWYEESGLELWERVRTALARPRRGIGLIILGVVTLITLIASAVTASVSLAQSVQTASIVDDLAKNTSKALGIQEDIDRKLEDRLNALYDAVRFLGEEVQGLKLRTKIRCHANYRWICVTPKIYNNTETPWNKIKLHLDGIWHNENISLDLLQLHQEILDTENAPRASMDLAENAEEFVNSLFSNFPSITSLWHLFSGVVAMLLVLALFVCITPCIIKKFVKELWDIKAVLHSNYLRQKNQACHFTK